MVAADGLGHIWCQDICTHHGDVGWSGCIKSPHCITGHLQRESTKDRWFPLTKGQWCEKAFIDIIIQYDMMDWIFIWWRWQLAGLWHLFCMQAGDKSLSSCYSSDYIGWGLVGKWPSLLLRCFQREHKHIFTFCVIPPHRYDTGT